MLWRRLRDLYDEGPVLQEFPNCKLVDACYDLEDNPRLEFVANLEIEPLSSILPAPEGKQWWTVPPNLNGLSPEELSPHLIREAEVCNSEIHDPHCISLLMPVGWTPGAELRSQVRGVAFWDTDGGDFCLFLPIEVCKELGVSVQDTAYSGAEQLSWVCGQLGFDVSFQNPWEPKGDHY